MRFAMALPLARHFVPMEMIAKGEWKGNIILLPLKT
jgi:hypothetical protein